MSISIIAILKEMKHLKEIITDKDQELEHKTRELEQFRYCFTASTSRQRIDSLPRSLAAQTDNEENSQSPSTNNEISLCMD